MENEITDPKKKEQNKNEEFSLTKIIEGIGLFTAAIAVLSVVSAIIYRYISLGRCLYFDFDIDHYDFSLSNTSTLVFLLSVITGIVAGFLSLLAYILLNKLLMYVNRKLFKVIISMIICILYILFTIFITRFFIPEERIAFIFWFMLLVFTIITSAIILIFNINKWKRKIIYSSAVIIMMLLVIAPICMRIQYEEAKDQKTFPIIVEKIDGETNYYVVISEGKEKYSSYLCKMQEESGNGVLYIIIDVHKYFNVNDTRTTKVEFQEVKRNITTPLSVNDFAN